jgi:hypothetical protein
MRALRRLLTWTAVPLIVAQLGCAARGIGVASPRPSPISEDDRQLCEVAAQAEADGITGVDPGDGAMMGLGLAVHPYMIVMTYGVSLMLAPVAVVAGATVKGLEDRKLRKQAYTGAMNTCLDLVAREQAPPQDDADRIERGRGLAAYYRSRAETSVAASVRNATRAPIGLATPEPGLRRYNEFPSRPTVEETNQTGNLAMTYGAWSERDRAAALSLYRRALIVQERTLGPDHADVAETLTATRPCSAWRIGMKRRRRWRPERRPFAPRLRCRGRFTRRPRSLPPTQRSEGAPVGCLASGACAEWSATLWANEPARRPEPLVAGTLSLPTKGRGRERRPDARDRAGYPWMRMRSERSSVASTGAGFAASPGRAG